MLRVRAAGYSASPPSRCGPRAVRRRGSPAYPRPSPARRRRHRAGCIVGQSPRPAGRAVADTGTTVGAGAFRGGKRRGEGAGCAPVDNDRSGKMGQIVAAMASCHAPALFLRQPGEDPAQLDATVEAMRQLGRVLDETRPDALIILGLDHLEAFSLSVSPTFAVVVAPEVQGSFGPKQYR